jgi:hypothetical protein
LDSLSRDDSDQVSARVIRSSYWQQRFSNSSIRAVVLSHQSQHSTTRPISQPQRDRRLSLLFTVATLTFVLALRPELAANIPWQTIVGLALLISIVGGAVSSAMRVGDLYADTLARSSWPGRHEDE